MTRGTGATRAWAVDVTAVTGAAALSLAIVAFVGWSLVMGIAQEAWQSLNRPPPMCSSSMGTALTPDGERACVPEGTRLPQGWILLRPAD